MGKRLEQSTFAILTLYCARVSRLRTFADRRSPAPPHRSQVHSWRSVAIVNYTGADSGDLRMPLFRCPKCQREAYIPMAHCDEVLHKIPADENFEVHFVECVDCASGSEKLTQPVKWIPPNIQFADD